ncbi:MAG TPA: branched-chain amino acid ABC transporter permease [Gaiellaceae bacterium]|nr:branched-chain amino acid ABC transporter permease [Gaiellaceae bacterium]
MAVDVGKERLPARRKRPDVLSIIGILFVVGLFAILIVNLIDDPTQFMNVALIGLTTGSVYALVALGYTLVYGILQLINFAHGDVFALCGLIASSIMISLFDLTGEETVVVVAAGLLGTILLTMLFGSTLNATIEFLGYRRLRSQPRLTMLISAVGMSFIVQNISLAIYDVNYRSAPPLISTSSAFTIGGVSMSWNKVVVVLITIPVLILLTWLVRSTKQGKAMRATAQDQDAAAMMGINVNRTISFTFVLAGALAGAAGVNYLLQFQMRYDTGFELGLIAFTAAVLGGIGNLAGATLGGLLIGFIQAFNEGLSIGVPGSDWTRSIVFGILIAILVFRPEGLLGERTPEGV